MTRDQLLRELTKRYSTAWFKKGEEFSSNHQNSIWTSGEEGINSEGYPLFDYYNDNYIMGVHPEVEAFLNRHGYFAEFLDAGTVFIYKI